MRERKQPSTGSPAYKAWMLVAHAKNTGALISPAECDLCQVQVAALRLRLSKPGREILHAHHWRGYSEPLDVWWVCPSCHKRLRDRHLAHDGTVSLTEVQAMWRAEQGTDTVAAMVYFDSAR